MDFTITLMSVEKSGKINFVLIFYRKVGVRLIREGDLYVNHYGKSGCSSHLRYFAKEWHRSNFAHFVIILLGRETLLLL